MTEEKHYCRICGTEIYKERYADHDGLCDSCEQNKEDEAEQTFRSAQDVFDEFYACELDWARVRVPNENEFRNLLNTSVDLGKETQTLKNTQPICRDFLGEYDNKFSEYKATIENALQRNGDALHQLDGFLFAKERIENLRNTIDTLRDLRREKWHLLTTQSIEYTTRVLWNLVCLKREVENVNWELLAGLERVREELDKSYSILNELFKPTHEWIILDSEKKKRCTKCSKEIALGEIENKHTSDEKWSDEEWQKRIKRFRDAELL
jgi:hypothetical protein